MIKLQNSVSDKTQSVKKKKTNRDKTQKLKM